jgi:hypothetical protein
VKDKKIERKKSEERKIGIAVYRAFVGGGLGF